MSPLLSIAVLRAACCPASSMVQLHSTRLRCFNLFGSRVVAAVDDVLVEGRSFANCSRGERVMFTFRSSSVSFSPNFRCRCKTMQREHSRCQLVSRCSFGLPGKLLCGMAWSPPGSYTYTNTSTSSQTNGIFNNATNGRRKNARESTHKVFQVVIAVAVWSCARVYPRPYTTSSWLCDITRSDLVLI